MNDNASYFSSSHDDPLSGGLIKFKDYGNELMRRRTEQIEQVKKITTDVALLSNDIKLDTFAQGEKMNEIEGNIMKMHSNVTKAEKETFETEILTRKNKKGLYILVGIMLSLIILIIYFISKMIK
jgi:t-SNARE complex subunit (syntaxin)